MILLWHTKQALRIISNVDLLGRLVGVHSKKSQSTFSSSAYGKRKHWKTDIPGRIQLDMIDYIRRNHKVIIIENMNSSPICWYIYIYFVLSYDWILH